MNRTDTLLRLKRFRVAKVRNGKWFNTWMNADEASWVNDTDYDKYRRERDDMLPK